MIPRIEPLFQKWKTLSGKADIEGHGKGIEGIKNQERYRARPVLRDRAII